MTKLITIIAMFVASIVSAQTQFDQGMKKALQTWKNGNSTEALVQFEKIASVEKTGRVVVVQEAQKQAGVGAQVAAEIAERSILSLEAPIGRVAAPDTVFPFGQAEGAWLPNAKDIEDKVREIANF